MAIEWGLLDQNAFQRGYQHSKGVFDDLEAKRKQAAIDNALRQYALNPQDPKALNALAVAAPATAIPLMKDQRDALQAKHEKDAKFIGGLAASAKTPEAFDAAVDQVVQMGYPEAAQFKGKFSPQLRAALMAAGGVKDETTDLPNIAKEVAYYRSIGRDDLAQQLLQSHAEGPPVVAENPDGTKTIYPRSMLQGQTQTQATTTGGGPKPGDVEDGYRFKGGDPANPHNWEAVGGQTVAPSGGFP